MVGRRGVASEFGRPALNLEEGERRLGATCLVIVACAGVHGAIRTPGDRELVPVDANLQLLMHDCRQARGRIRWLRRDGIEQSCSVTANAFTSIAGRSFDHACLHRFGGEMAALASHDAGRSIADEGVEVVLEHAAWRAARAL